MLDQMQKAALSVFLAILKSSADRGARFRLLMTSKISGSELPLLILGNAHGQVEDGHLIAVLNPSQDLVEPGALIAGCSYTSKRLKEIVSGRCDAMISLWVDAYKEDHVRELCSYKSRKPRPIRLEIR